MPVLEAKDLYVQNFIPPILPNSQMANFVNFDAIYKLLRFWLKQMLNYCVNLTLQSKCEYLSAENPQPKGFSTVHRCCHD